MSKTTVTYHTLSEAAERMRVSPDTIKAAIRVGDLRAKRTGKNGGGLYIISSADLDDWFDGLVSA